MAGDLEDFLKRAAERRAAKQRQAGTRPTRPSSGSQQSASRGQRQATSQPKRQAPQYTDSRRERQIREIDDEPILLGEPVDTESAIVEQQKRIAETRRQAEITRKRLANAKRSVPTPEVIELGPENELSDQPTGNAIEDLLNNLSKPGGAQQAFLMNEILTRPNWDD
ncbi:hypothetical protein [Roseiconus lacunae]|uniref:Uncharacterized protein n=1 Tax=Roseiconus lacunae TaxID=2605694 RepID=A0ABT7PJB8_9BACT|nr:hypothetical protein [Roseiconus lacunae]MCD0461768.1 hypothetical protein [Roseiconus lacunae]MDM4016589.1 hypothetical protein [Roseiconus lacunae]WRQ49458.1 hypothetical protein U8335_21175 [Stieleria sp. HD01]